MSESGQQTLILDGLPPSINHYYGYRTRRDSAGMQRDGARLQKFPSKEGKAFKKYVALACLAQRIEPMPEGVHLSVKLVFHTKNRRRMDIDNRVKVLLDSLMPHVISDDCWVWELIVSRKVATPERTTVVIGGLVG
jgi:Holliday junction resolvase RusA-like endonuclease